MFYTLNTILWQTKLLNLLHRFVNNDFHILQTADGVEYLELTPDRGLIFPSVDYVRNLVTKHSIRQAIPVVINCSHVYGADYTAAKVIEIRTVLKDSIHTLKYYIIE